MYYIIYLSAGTKWFDEPELQAILASSNEHNSRNNITGLLLYNQGDFIQLLEGEESDVMATFERISLDARHKGITHIASGQLKKRNFPRWAMGFKLLNDLSMQPLKAYLDPTNKSLLPGADQHLSIKLLKAFVRTARMAV